MTDCSRCGKENPGEAQFCGTCGADISSPKNQESMQRIIKIEKTVNKNFKTMDDFGFISIMLVVLSTALFMIYWFLSENQPIMDSINDYYDYLNYLQTIAIFNKVAIIVGLISVATCAFGIMRKKRIEPY